MKALVTGGAGFLGSAIAQRLRARGDSVRSLSRGAHPELAASGIEALQGDLADRDAVEKAVAGCDVVFHVAAKVGAWGPREAYWQTNVLGTQHVIDACVKQGVAKLVYTSTPSVVHDGGDIEGGDESLPYAQHFDCAYPESKAEAERRVLAANGDALATVALRPHLIWGPGDPHLVPRLLARARAGRLRWIGSGEKRVDATYIDNAADAHLAACDRLAPGAPCAGRAYFIAQGEALPARELSNAILDAAGLPPVVKRVPVRLAWLAGTACEMAYRWMRRDEEPPLTRFLVSQASTAHWYSLDAARRDLGYAPAVSMQEGLERLRRRLRSDTNARASGEQDA